MPLTHLMALAVIQGLTEFLPVSSSGHLALYPLLTGFADQGQEMDVAVHVGSLLAVVLYFRADVAALIRGGLGIVRGRGGADARLLLMLAVATLPVMAAGLAVKLAGVENALRDIGAIGWATLIGGVILWWADARGAETRRAADWSFVHALAMGVAQVFALAPGASRSGVTMTMARALGYRRTDAARLSLLMSIPTIIAAGALIALEIAESGDAALGADAALAALLAFASAYLALAGMMRMFRSWTMAPFALYRLALGAALLWIAYS